jgi:hypothetical protein
MRADEELVFVVDLTTREIESLARDIERGGPETSPRTARRDEPSRPIRRLALLLDTWEEPLLLPVEPTRDAKLLDALARLLRIAVLAGERVPTVAIDYGEEYERTLAFERRLPDWVYSGVDARTAARLPPRVRLVLGPTRARRSRS